MTTKRREIGVVHYGLGPIGRAIATLVAERPGVVARAAIDIDPAMVGRDLSEVIESTRPTSARVAASIGDAAVDGAMVAVHSTGSSFDAVLPQLLELVERGLHVVSTCEELSWADRGTERARRLDEAARSRGVAVLGTGVNPGFAMDYLPLALSGVMADVRSIEVTRVQDATLRRVPLQRKIGASLSAEQFRALADAGRLGHVGLRESALGLAVAFGWATAHYDERLDPVIAQQATPSGLGEIEPGAVLGIHQVARLETEDREHAVVLDLTIAVNAPGATDRVVLRGDPDVVMEIPGGLPGDAATAAIVVNTIPRIVAASPGLRTMADLPPPHPWGN
jgi:4-hydroxy-tetrahydrodipicolinate reductase